MALQVGEDAIATLGVHALECVFEGLPVVHHLELPRRGTFRLSRNGSPDLTLFGAAKLKCLPNGAAKPFDLRQ
jgi:hypothetical protein